MTVPAQQTAVSIGSRVVKEPEEEKAKEEGKRVPEEGKPAGSSLCGPGVEAGCNFR